MAFAAAGDLATCQRLVEHRAQVDCFDQFGCGAVHYARAFSWHHIEEYFENMKHMPELGLKDDSVTDATYLSEAASLGCCAAVWRVAMRNRNIASMEAKGVPATNAVVHFSQPVGPYDNTPLHLAIEAARDGKDAAGQVCRALILVKADVTARTKKGDTPLHLAAGAGHKDLYEMVLGALASQLGGKKFAQKLANDDPNSFGQTPKQYLERSIVRQELREEHAALSERELLLHVGIIAFRHCAMLARLELWREDEAVSFCDILSHRRPFFGSLERFEGSGDSDIDNLKTDSVQNRSVADFTSPGTIRSITPGMTPNRSFKSLSRKRSQRGITFCHDPLLTEPKQEELACSSKRSLRARMKTVKLSVALAAGRRNAADT